jgi:hypothetical protein
MSKGFEPKGKFEVGYAKPPVATRFKKGMSGNPSGRPRNRGKSVEDLILQETNRPIIINEGGKRKKVTVIEAVLRSHLASAIKGNGPNQRAVIRLAKEMEDRERALRDEALEWGIKYQLTAQKIAWERHKAGLPEDNDPSRPRPEDVIIIPHTGEVMMMRADVVVPQLTYDPSKKPRNLLDELKQHRRRCKR